MPYIQVEEGVRIFVEDLNLCSEQTVLFIHGWPANHKMFEYQFNQLPKCDIRCIGMDIRGFGKSDKPWHGYCYNTLADDVRCVIEAFGLENITLLGFSVGGAIATRYMARHSGYGVAKLALASSATPLFTRRQDYPFAIPVAEVNKLISQTYTDRPKMISDFGDTFFASSLSCEFKNWFNGLGLEASGHATASLAISLRDEDLRRDARQIRIPTAIFHGVHDQIVPFPSAEETHRYIRNSILIPFEFSGHGLVIDERDKFNYCLAEFVNT
ncbi:MAG TPA: alpha/beta hydrolase [Methylomusa anaerophila]|uniref:Arylesterase n=1 Tax=Methylomusa anaerophila TaxID=1930071 RepID=A0A348ALK2_9FIRM|nr:alpha/beta hydrolase [Methylomusa anaerophila]BBB91950.1 arylesterase [Methylomusa anaerophila]HML88038.1 alpha/beta hydrolase [Methylomusa anaerophila]